MSYNVGSQGTYLDTILPRADLAENQAAMPEIGEKYHHSKSLQSQLLQLYFDEGQRVRLSKGDILQTTALYQCPGCGRTYQVLHIIHKDPQKLSESRETVVPCQDTAAKFGSPQHSPLYSPPSGAEPVSFKKGDKCEWRILATHGEKIILNITSLDIPASANCHLDYLEVRSVQNQLNFITNRFMYG